MAKCQNGGACLNGQCVCQKGFSGDFCEENENESSNIGWYILIILFLAALGVGGYLLYKKNQDSWQKSGGDNDGPNKQFIEGEKKPTMID